MRALLEPFLGASLVDMVEVMVLLAVGFFIAQVSNLQSNRGRRMEARREIDSAKAHAEAAKAAAKRASRERLESDERSRLLLDNLKDLAIFMLDPEGRIKEWSAGAERITGFTAYDMLNKHFAMFFTDEDRLAKIPEKELATARSNGRSPDIRWHKRKNGEAYWADGFTTALYDEEGHLKGFSKVTRDQTERKLAEDALRESREALREKAELLDLSSDAISVRDEKDRILFWNEGAERTFGWSKSEAIGSIHHDLLSTCFPTPLVEIKNELLNKGYWRGEVVHICRDGSEIVVSSRWELQRSGEHHWRLLETDTDITAKKKAMRALEESEANFRLLAEAIPQMVWTASPDGALEYCNKRWLSSSGMAFEKLHGHGWLDIFHPEDRTKVIAALAEATRKSQVLYEEARVRSPLGQYRWHLCRAVPLLDDRGRIARWFGTNTDIQDQKKWQEDLAKARDAAEEANRAKSAFLTNMSHEIRTPLGAIVGFAELLKDESINFQKRREFVDTINRNGQDLSRLIDDILDLSKVEAGRLEIERLDIELPKLIDEFQQSLSIKAREKGIGFEFVLDGPIPESIVSDPTRLRQILLNIVGNAIKFTRFGRVDVKMKWAEPTSTPNGQLIFVVTDTGRGIAEDQIKNLFQPFTQADPSTTRKYGGTGLGLVLSRRLARMLGGDVILARSELGVGSTFVIAIDSGVANPKMIDNLLRPAPAALPSLREGHPSKLSGIRVLLAEDALDNQVLIKHLLVVSGAKVDVVCNGADAVETAMQDNYDVVLMDIQMPVMDGYNATINLRKQGYKKPIIALTAHAMREEKEKCILAGCTDHLAKPINQGILVSIVAQHAHSELH